MRRYYKYGSPPGGFTMIEMVIVIAVIGILLSITLPMIGSVSTNIKVAETEREMQALAYAICGNPEIKNINTRSDFGYLGDVGVLPSNLDDLVENPGGFATWKGPYVSNNFEEITGDFKTDAWNVPYIYSGGTQILSVGSGDTIVCNLASSRERLLYNSLSGNITDIDNTPPPSTYSDSFLVRIAVPNGLGGVSYRYGTVSSGGYFAFDSLSIGNRALEIIYLPKYYTLRENIPITPGGIPYLSERLHYNIWFDELTIVPAGLVGYWRLNQNSGTRAFDESGAGNDATLFNMDPGSDWVSGRAGNGLDFDGSDDYLDCGGSNAFELNQITIACWVNSTESAAYRQLVCKNQGAGMNSYYLSLNNLRPAVFLGGTSNEGWHQAFTSLTPGQWHHVAFTYDGNRVIIYIDGSADRVISPVTGTVNPNSGTPVWIGSRSDIAGREFDGVLDDVRIYNRPLRSSEIVLLSRI